MRTLAARDYAPRIAARRRKADRTARFIVMVYAMACLVMLALVATLII